MNAQPAPQAPPEGLAQWAFTCAQGIAAALTLAELDALMGAAVRAVGFTEYYLLEDAGRGPRVVLGSASAPLIRLRYATEGGAPMADDIIHRTARQTTDAFFYSDVLARAEASDQDRTNMDARKASGVGEGFVGIRRRLHGGVATSTVMLAPAPVPRTPEVRLAVSLIAEAYGDAARRLDRRPPPPVALAVALGLIAP